MADSDKHILSGLMKEYPSFLCIYTVIYTNHYRCVICNNSYWIHYVKFIICNRCPKCRNNAFYFTLFHLYMIRMCWYNYTTIIAIVNHRKTKYFKMEISFHSSCNKLYLFLRISRFRSSKWRHKPFLLYLCICYDVFLHRQYPYYNWRFFAICHCDHLVDTLIINLN